MSIFIWSLLLPLVVGIEREIKLEDFVVKIDDGLLMNIVQLRDSNELNISNLNIRAIKQSAFQNVNVQSLNLDGNELSLLPENIFSNLKNLRYLSLGQNEIKSTNNAFVGLENLKMLNLSYNPIDILKESEFRGVPKLSKILTKGNAFENISSRVFEDSTTSAVMLKDEAMESDVEELDEDETSYVRSKRLALFKKSIGKIPQLKNTVVNVCIDDGVLRVVEVSNESQARLSRCKKVIVKFNERYLDLDGLGIKAFRKGWYQLQEVEIFQINLSGNEISDITLELLNDLPRNVEMVNLDKNVIKTIKSNVIENEYLKTLDLRNNLIENIENGAFERTKCEKLYLSSNKLVDINFVSSLPATLTELILNKNGIQRIPDGIFLNLSNVFYLNMGSNAITDIKSNAFQGLVNVRFLILSTNNISKFEPGSLTTLRNLETLYLKKNSISNFERGTFAQAISLKDINLVDNKFTKITKDTFADLPGSLEKLNLGSNEISSLEEGSFVGVPKKQLHLNDNLISTILPGTFDIKNLQDLFLNKNSIETISQDVFKGLSGLGRLWLSGNRISEIEKGSARYFGSLTTLDISNNPFQRLNNGALYGISKDKPCFVLVEDNQIEMIQGGLFDDV